MKSMPIFSAAAVVAVFACSAAIAAAPAYRLVDRIAGGDGGWDLASVDPIAHRLYVARSDSVMGIDLASGKASALIPVEHGHAALAIPGTREVIATDGNGNDAIIFNGKTGAVRAKIATGKKPDAVAYDPATRRLFVMNADDGSITVIDSTSAKVLATIAVGGSLELGAADGKGRLFVNVEDRNEVAVIDTRALRVLSRFPLAGCDGPTGIAYDPVARRLVSACANGKAIVSATDGRLVASLDVGPRPDGAAFDSRRKVALVPSGGDGTLSIIQLGGTPAIVERVTTAKGARTIAVDASTGRAYLPSADYMPAVGKERPKMVPGSFRVLVVAPAKS